ncbi:MAG TPA: ABC transporter substrate-binding protein [Geminicoccaceae bacterium]|nr:ABC transporter substrate-binding protein [Geminicoccaceae bacterium]
MKVRLLAAAAGIAVTLGVTDGPHAKTLVHCSFASPDGFNASLVTGTATSDVTRQVQNRLVEFELGTTNIVPALAESWEISSNGAVYTFNLRQGVKFHTTKNFTPSREFNADDVLYSWNRMWKAGHPDHMLGGGTYETFTSNNLPELLKSIDKIDDHTVRFVLNRPEAPFIAMLTDAFAATLSAEYAEAMRQAGTPEKIDHEPVGTGPFVFVDYQKDSTIRLNAFDDYWNGRPKIDTLIFAITPDAAVRYAKLKAGECHVAALPNPADLEAMRQDPNIRLIEEGGLNVGYLAFNTGKEPYTNKKVRQALNMAVDKQAIVDAVFQGSGMVAKNPIPPAQWSYNDNVKDYPYDPEPAKKLLAEAGYPDGFETDLWAMPVARPYNPNARRMAEMLQTDFAAVGVKADIVSYEWGEYMRRSQAGEHEMLLLGWTSDNGDPDNMLNVLLGCAAAKDGANRARWCHKPYDDLMIEAKVATSVAERTRLYEEAQLIAKEEAPWIPIAHSIVFVPVRKEVVNYKVDPFGAQYYHQVDLR